MTSNGSNEISFVDSRLTRFQRPIEKESNVLVDIGKVCRLLGLRCLQCVMRGLRVVVIVLICKNIVRICYKNEKEVKQVVGKRINKKRYFDFRYFDKRRYFDTSMVFTLFGLHTRRDSHDGSRDRCRGILTFLTPSNKLLFEFS